MRKLECDRCEVSLTIGFIDQWVFSEPLRLPAGWIELDGSHVCPECELLFRQFMRGEAVPAKTMPIGCCEYVYHTGIHPQHPHCTNWKQKLEGPY